MNNKIDFYDFTYIMWIIDDIKYFETKHVVITYKL